MKKKNIYIRTRLSINMPIDGVILFNLFVTSYNVHSREWKTHRMSRKMLKIYDVRFCNKTIKYLNTIYEIRVKLSVWYCYHIVLRVSTILLMKSIHIDLYTYYADIYY